MHAFGKHGVDAPQVGKHTSVENCIRNKFILKMRLISREKEWERESEQARERATTQYLFQEDGRSFLHKPALSNQILFSFHLKANPKMLLHYEMKFVNGSGAKER